MTTTTVAAAPARSGAVLISAALGSALNPLNSTMVAVALPALSRDFGAPASTVTVSVITGYLVATLVSQMPAGSIADRIGFGRALSLGRWLFFAGAIAATVAPRLEVVVIGRLLMAAGGALIVPTAMALVRVMIPPERRSRAFGTLGAVLGAAAAIGPAVGAWIVAHFGWRALFIANVPLIAGSWLWQPPMDDDGRADASGTNGRRTRETARPFDWPGSILVGVALVLLTFATRVAAPISYALAAAGLAAVVALVYQERRAVAPVLLLPLFGVRGFIAGAGVIAFQNLAMYSLLIMVPFVFGARGGGDTSIGVAIVAMTATMAIASPLGGWAVEYAGARVVVAAGSVIGGAGVAVLAQLSASASAAAVGMPLLLVGLGLGLSTGPSQAVALSCVDADQSGIASATVSMLRYLGAIAGTVILGYALGGGAADAARQQAALWTFTAAFGASAVLALIFPAMPALQRNR